MPHLITRNEAAELSGASPSLVNKAIEQRLVGTTSVGRASLLKPKDVGVLALFARLGTDFTLSKKHKRRLSEWICDATVGAELKLADPLIVRKTPEIAKTIEDAARYVEQRERLVEIDPDRQGGEPVIRGTRIPIRGLAKQVEAGESRELIARQYDYIDPAAFEFAVRWARANPRRGRPKAGERGGNGPEPPERRRYLARRRHTASVSAA